MTGTAPRPPGKPALEKPAPATKALHPADLLEELTRGGVYLAAAEGKLLCRAENGALTAERRALIAEHRDRLLAFLASAEPAAEEPRPEPRPAGTPVPLSPTQRRLWFLERLSGSSADTGTGYVVPLAFRLLGPLDAGALARAVEAVVARHESLHSRVEERGGEPFAVPVERPFTLPEPLELPGVAAEEALAAHLAAALEERIDLTREGPVRARLLRFAAEDHALVLVIHHIAVDGGSSGIVLREIGDGYRAETGGAAPGPPAPALDYGDYVLWHEAWMRGERLETGLRYWREQLERCPALHDLPTDRPRAGRPSPPGASLRRAIPLDLAAALAEIARREGATPFAFHYACFAAFLSRWSGAPEVAVATPAANRPLPELEGVVGFFANTLVLRLAVEAHRPFSEVLAGARATALDAFAHQHVPFERVVDAVHPPRRPGVAPLAQIAFSLVESDGAPGLDLPGIAASPLLPEARVARFDLTLDLVREGEGWIASWDYDASLFDGETVASMARAFEALLRGIVADRHAPVSSLPLTTAEDRQQRLAASSGESLDFGPEARLDRLFATQAVRAPDAVAARHGGEAWSYRALRERADAVARGLAAAGTLPGDTVALAMERSLGQLAVILGTLQAGAAYLPLPFDPPDARLAFLLEDSGTRRVVVGGGLRPRLAALVPESRLLEAEGLLAGSPSAPPDLPASQPPDSQPPDSQHPGTAAGLGAAGAAYITYTSGSTGRPKGVVNGHAGAANRMRDMARRWPWAAGDSMLYKGPFGFDLSVMEIFVTLFAGGTLELVDQGAEADAGHLAALVAERGTRMIHFVPSMLQAFLEHPRARRCTSLRHIFCGGEAMSTALARRCREVLPRAELHNLYGPTEAAVTVSQHDLGLEADIPDPVPIGRPSANTRLLLLDARGELVPRGMRGELHIGGPQVALGYLHRPAGEAAAFLPDPFSPDPFSPHGAARMYRTGDLARRRGDGALQYLGRGDRQLKIRGKRIEPGEIEAVLEGGRGVSQAVVVADADERLAAFLVSDAEEAEREQLVRRHATEHLPAHMVPDAFVFLDALPLNAHGKLDLAALPAADFGAAPAHEHAEPAPGLESELAALWADLLPVDSVSATANFFALGGHSLLLTRLQSRILAELGREVPLAALFSAQTLRAQAALLAEEGGTGPGLPAPTRRGGPPVLSHAQRRLWFIERLGGAEGAYNIPLALRLRGELDRNRLATALSRIAARHAALRTRIVEEAGEPGPEVDAPAELPLVFYDLAELGETARPVRLEQMRDAEAARPFALDREWPLRAQLLRLREDEHVLLLTLHHSAGDGWSVGVLLDELAHGYRSGTAAPTDALPRLELDYADYAAWQQGWMQGERIERLLAYWRQALWDLPALHALPTDHPRPVRQDFRGAAHRQTLGANIAGRLRRLARRHDATLFMVLEAAFAVLLGRWSGADDVVLGTPIANRRHEALAPLIGFFANTLVLRTDLGGEPDFAEVLRRTRAAALGAFEHQDLPFEVLVERLQPRRSLAHSPLFQILFAFQERETARIPRLEGLQLEDIGGRSRFAKLDLTLNLRECAGGLEADWEYARALFEPRTIERLAEGFAVLLDGLAADPSAPISTLPLTADPACRSLLEGPALPAGAPATVTESLAGPAEAIALAEGPRTLRYADLHREAEGLAARLRERGVARDEVVAVVLPRGIDAVLAQLAVLRAGGAFLPLDPALPRERLKALLEDSRPKAWVGRPGDDDGEDPRFLSVAERGEAGALPRPEPGDLAYLIYTSGSTGRPKAVEVEHRNLAALLAHACRELAFHPTSRAAVWTNPGFDVALVEVFAPLAAGARVVFPPEDIRLSPGDYLDWLARESITHAYLPPFLVRALAALPDERIAALALQSLLVGVEPLEEAGLRRLERLCPGLTVVNGYGPSETTVYSTSYGRVADLARVCPIGTPIAGTTVALVDRGVAPVAVGAVGEILIAGAGVARGYRDRRALTEERFVRDRDGRRWYRTGDLGRVLPSGDLEFRGRVDRQVKVGGVRLEPGEIEAALGRQPDIAEAAVVALETPGEAEKVWVAYVVTRGGAALDASGLRGRLARSLPRWALPSRFIELAALPLTASGKTDYRALPAPEAVGGQAANAAGGERGEPESEMQRTVAAVWREVLGASFVGAGDDFFDLGGHSLAAVRVMARLRAETGRALPISALFEAPTMAELARRLEAWQPPADDPLVTLQPGEGGAPLFLFHAAGGDVLAYQPLLRHLPAHLPVHGLIRRELPNQRVPGFPSVEAMAAGYVERLRAVQPHGPYRLGGWSSGGLLALEAAHRLETLGEEVACVLVVDATLASEMELPPELAELGLEGLDSLAPDEALAALRRFETTLPEARSTDDRLDIPVTDYFEYLVAANQVGLCFHRPAFQVAAPVFYFGCARNDTLSSEAERVRQIQTLAASPLRAFTFDATHFGILEEPQVGALGRAIREVLDPPPGAGSREEATPGRGGGRARSAGGGRESAAS